MGLFRKCLYGSKVMENTWKKFKRLYWIIKSKRLERLRDCCEEIIFFDGCYINYKHGEMQHSNWGDDLNYYFFSYICKEKFIGVPYTQFDLIGGEHYILIGSILNCLNLNKSIVYGSGIGTPSQELTGKPLKVLSVRGPRTREILVRNGIDCPEKYGDPALLLSIFYKPEIKKQTTISIIPHERTVIKGKMDLVEGMIKDNNFRVINPRNYCDWKDVVNQICESRLVISESLHGLIVAETYGIPSVWVEFEEHPADWSFKFLDFYESIGKYSMKSIKLYQACNWEEIMNARKSWSKGNINYDVMLETFPFKMKSEMLKRVSSK